MTLEQTAGELCARAFGSKDRRTRNDRNAAHGLYPFDRRSVVSYVITAGVVVWVGLFAPAPGFCAVTIKPGTNIQNAVNDYPSGTTFVLTSGLYRLQSVVPKNGDVFEGQTGAVLNGSRLLTSFQRSGSYWIATGQSQQGVVWTGHCEKLADGLYYDGCVYPEDLFFDNKPLRHVGKLSEIGPGKWYFDYPNNVIYMVDDPAGHKVETSVKPFAFAGSATNVTVKNLVIEKYAVQAEAGAIGNLGSGTGWHISNDEIRLNHGAGINASSYWVVSSDYTHDNGQYGIKGSGSNIVVQDNQIARNNYAGFNFHTGAGGTKFLRTKYLVVRRNNSHHNVGPGLWDDTDNIYSLYENNLCVHNAGPGIMHEISYNILIRYNLCVHNGLIPRGWLYESQILISSSPNGTIYNNLAVVGPEVNSSGEHANGITIIQQDRGTGAYGPHLTTGNHIHTNVVNYLGSIGQTGAAADYEPSVMYGGGNLFDSDIYHAGSLQTYHWAWNGNLTWSGFRAKGQEAHGSADTDVLSDDVTSPSTPTGLVAVAASDSVINLSWRASTDNVALAGYRIYRNNSPIAFSLKPSFSDTGLHSNTTFSYSVAAVDTSGNISSKSTVVSETTF
jgi:hypothetical protein